MAMGIRQIFARLTDSAQFDLRAADGVIYDLGCGNSKHPGAIGVDVSADTAADVVHDLDRYPWPIEDGVADVVILQDVIEHVEDAYRFMAEVHRICRPGGVVRIRTPHFSSALAYGDPTHRRYLSVAGVRTLAQPGFDHYTTARFDIVSVTVDGWLPARVTGLQRLCNAAPDAYEKYFAFIMPSMNIQAEFRAVP